MYINLLRNSNDETYVVTSITYVYEKKKKKLFQTTRKKISKDRGMALQFCKPLSCLA